MAAQSVPSRTPARRAPGQRRAHKAPHTRQAPARPGGPGAERGGPAGDALGKDAKIAATAGQSPLERRQASRAEKLDARRRLGTVTTLPRLAKCGRVSMGDEGEVCLRYADGAKINGTAQPSAGFGGLATCGSVWACPVCSAKITARRADELTKLINWNAERNGTTCLLTLTMRHHKGHRLKTLRKGLTGAWRHVTQSRGWKRIRRELGMDGYVRAIEATHSPDNGWHLHIHCLLTFDGPVSIDMVDLFGEEVWEHWRTGLEMHGFSALRERGVDVRVGHHALERLGNYINKIAFEAVGSRWKKGRKTSRTPFQILADGLATGLMDDFELWFEWEQGSKGMQQIRWSTGLKDRVGVTDQKDEEIAEETENGETIAILPARTWAKVYPIAEQLLTATENGGPDGAFAWLDGRGLAYDVHGHRQLKSDEEQALDLVGRALDLAGQRARPPGN